MGGKELWAVIALMGTQAYAYDFDILKLDEFNIDYKNYKLVNDKARNMLIYPDHPKEAVNLGINLDLLKYGYWDSTVESLTTEAQYKAIGLETRLGIRLSPGLDLGYWHHSQHVIDSHHTYMDKFPSEDAIEVRLIIYRARPGRESIF